MAIGYPDLVPTLTDGVVTLRAMRADDLPAVVEQSRDPETARWTMVPQPYGPEDAAAFFDVFRNEWESGERASWVVEADGRFAGLVSHRPRGRGAAEVSFAAHPAERGRGNLSRAVRLVCEHAFEEGAKVVLWHAKVGNLGSRKVVWRNGFRITGPLHQTRRGELVEVWSGSLTVGEPMEPRHPWLEPVLLERDGVRLRPFRPEDGAAMPERWDEAAARFMPTAAPTREGFDDWLLTRRIRAADGESIVWAITDPATGAVLGCIEVFRLNHPGRGRSGMVGYWVLPAARGRGVLARAVDAVVAHAFMDVEASGLGVPRLAAGCAQDNLASAGVLRRAGFREIGTERILLPSGEEDANLLFDVLATDDRAGQRVHPARPPVLETDHLRLRPWRDTDGPAPGDGPDDASRRFMPAGAHPDGEGFPAWLRLRRGQMAQGDSVNWCVADRQSDRALGNVTLFRMGPAAERFQGEVGYWLHPSARGRHVLGEALESVITHALAPTAEGGLGLTRLHAGTDLDNTASQAVLERAGFQQWGADRMAYRRSSGELTDGAYYELLSTDPRTDQRVRHRTPVPDVTLEGERVRLRPWRDEDTPRVEEACREQRTRHWLAGLPLPYTAENAAAYLASCRAHARAGTGLFLAMADPVDDRCVGSIAVMGLRGEDPTSGECGYWTHPDARGRGMMTEALTRLVRHAFAPQDAGGLGLRRLTLRAAAGNAASQHVAQATGFVATGLQRQAERLGDGSFDDLVDYDLLASDWSAR